MTLLDQVAEEGSAPFYIGIFQIFLVLGPALGNLAGGRFLEIYTDFERADTPSFDSSSTAWVGAWWLGFVIGWFLTWLCALVLFCYPATFQTTQLTSQKIACTDETTQTQPPKTHSRTPSSVSNRRLTMSISRLSTGSNIVKVIEDESLKTLREITKKIFQLFKNPTYILLCIGGGLDGIVISGLTFFLPKFIQSQYGYTASDSSLVMGLVVVPAGGLGTFLGGYLVKRFRMSREQILRMYIYCQLITIPCSLGFLFYCQDALFAGVNVEYGGSNNIHSSDSLTLSSECNNNCGYLNNKTCGGLDNFAPVCGSDNKLYFNPCYAGCGVYDKGGNYTNCSCIFIVNYTENMVDYASSEMTDCTSKCKLFIGFVVTLFVTIWFTCMSAMPCVACILRFVEPENKSVSLGIANIIVRYTNT